MEIVPVDHDFSFKDSLQRHTSNSQHTAARISSCSAITLRQAQGITIETINLITESFQPGLPLYGHAIIPPIFIQCGKTTWILAAMHPGGSLVPMIKTKIGAIIFLMLFFMSACTAKSKEIEFLKLIPAENINDKITLTIPTELNENPLYECATIQMKNNSSDSMRFPIDYGIKLYVYDDNDQRWEEIINDANYSISV